MERLVIDDGLNHLAFGDRGYDDVAFEYINLVDVAGGSETLAGLTGRNNQLWGDANGLGGTAQGGNDVLLGAKGQVVAPGSGGYDGFDTRNLLRGDAAQIVDTAKGGNDLLKAGARASNTLYGDGDLSPDTLGGDDRLKGGGHGVNLFVGDGTLGGYAGHLARAGNDTIKGGAGADNTLVGDTEAATYAICGDDRLIGGRGTHNLMVGDFLGFIGTPVQVQAGNDTLVSGRGADDDMWGDGGPDATGFGSFARGDNVFVFARGGAHDTIHDFHQGHDRIDLTAWAAAGIHGLGDIATVLVDRPGNRTILYFEASGADTVIVAGATALNAADFVFA